MARKLVQPLDFTQLEALNIRMQQLSSAPGSPVSGQFWYNTTNARPQWRDASANNDIYPFATANTPTTGVLRDGSGNFAAGTITAALTGTASQATTLDATGGGSFQSGTFFLARANHTGTQLAATISNFDTQVRTSRLDQMAAPTGPVTFNSQNITNLLDPVNPQDAATKIYVDSVATGLQFKTSCRVATAAALPAYTRTTNVITASANGVLANVDGVTLIVGDRLLLKDGASGVDNGIYTVTSVGSGGTPFVLTRSTDADSSAEVKSGMYTFIEEGTVNDNQGWVLATPNPITLNVTSLSFTQFTGTGEITAGNGITKTGNTLSVNATANFTFASSQLELSSVGTAGTYTKVTTDAFGRVTAGADIITSNGIVVRTGAGTFAAGTVTGTAARITVTGGGGATPTIDIASTYVGQATITTLGTIGTGVWQGTIVGTTFGGTGLDTHLAANGTLLIGNAAGFTLATLTQGANVTITNGAGTITIAATGTIGGSIASTQVAFGSGSNTITGSANFTYVAATGLSITTGTQPLTLTQSAAASGSPSAILLTAAAHTNLTTTQETPDVDFNLNRTVQWATGTIVSQRAVVIRRPTYAFVGASTITTAASFAISGAPAAGTNATITNSYALWIQAGLAQFDGTMAVVGVTTHNGTVTFNTATANIVVTQGVAATGSPTAILYTGAAHTTLTASTEATDVNFNMARTVQFAQGALATQRAVRFQAPTYAFATGASTLTKAATVSISGAPVAGTNATLTNSYALWIEAGLVQMDGTMAVVGASTHGGTATFNTASANIVVTQGVATSGSPTAILYTGAAHTTLAAGAEAIDVNFNMARTVQFATGAIATQRAAVFQAPTYGFVAGSTVTNAATVAITGAPVAGTNATLTNSYALWVQGGVTRFDGNLSLNDAVNIVLGTTTGTKIGTATTQKLGFFNATPVVQQTGEVATALSALGLVTSGTYAAASITGTLGVANGGTGVNGSSAANGTLLIGNGSGYTLATLTQGTGITITNGVGTITIAASATLTNKFAASVGNGALTTFTVTHNLGTLDVVVTIFDNGTGAEVITDVVHATTNTLTVTFAVAPTSNQYRVVVVG